MQSVWLPDAGDVTQIHQQLIRFFSKNENPIIAGFKDDTLLESACYRPHTRGGGRDKYPRVQDKLAALFHSLAKSHIFLSGNKRTALTTLITCLYRNQRIINKEVSDDSIYEMVINVNQDKFPVPQLTHDEIVAGISLWISRNTQTLQNSLKTMKTTEFLECCEQAGSKFKRSNSSYVISHHTRSVRISQSTKELSGPVVRTYLKRLKLSEAHSGINFHEFKEGISAEQKQIRRFRQILDRL